MEALAAGVPVAGSALGGLVELIEPGVTGWLLPHDDVQAWSRQLHELCAARDTPLRFGPERVTLSTTADVARAMLALYEALA
jgi:glycosyltransferase involved in cell wall biosynthesis